MNSKVRTDGKSQKGRPVRGTGECNSPHSNRGMGKNKQEGEADGYDQDRFIQGYSPGENLFSRIESLIEGADFDPGKVLEAVRLIREAHLSYVRAHKQRLETRLDEAKENEADFIKSCDLLEQKIQGFMDKTQTVSETED
ncbi:hypothetical protein [Calothrix sp. NIES-2098]|uniref:hypothetical protein n=1 Tax=Calothrix sp. NIES-2098 TaxID=1954171 RepID=UPI0030D7E4FB